MMTPARNTTEEQYAELQNAKTLLQALGLEARADEKDSLPLYNRVKGQPTKQDIDQIEIDWFNYSPATNNNGYVVYYATRQGVRYTKYQHILVWESHNGKLPYGYEIHHIDLNRSNNDITNLQAMTASDHRRIHAGIKVIDGQLHRPCSKCKQMLPLTNEYFAMKRNTMIGLNSTCKKCDSNRSNEYQKMKKAIKKQLEENN